MEKWRKGIYKWKEGGEYEGEYRDNIREGKGIFRWKNGIIFEGNFVDGKPEADIYNTCNHQCIHT